MFSTMYNCKQKVAKATKVKLVLYANLSVYFFFKFFFDEVLIQILNKNYSIKNYIIS